MVTSGQVHAAEDHAGTGPLAGYLAWDLSRIGGLLSEIATCWRRAHDSRPDLPLSLPLELGEEARRAGAGIRALPDADPAGRAGLALTAARRIAALREACASAAALTQAGDAVGAGDRELWESITAALHRAGIQALDILLRVSTVMDWSLEDEPENGRGTWLRLEIR